MGKAPYFQPSPQEKGDRASGGGGGELVILLEYYCINGPLNK